MAVRNPNEQALKDLNKVVCHARVHSYGHGGGDMGTGIDFETQITDELVENINRTTEMTAVKSPMTGVWGRGAGGAGAMVLTSIRIIGAIARLVTKIPFLKLVQRRALGDFLKTRPTIAVELSISSKHHYDSVSEIHPLALRLASLLLVAATETSRLRRLYPTFRIGYKVSLWMEADDISVTYNILPNQDSPVFDNRIQYAATGFVYQKWLSMQVSVTSIRLLCFLIERHGISDDKKTMFYLKRVAFYTFFSRSVVGGFVKIPRVMVPAQLKKLSSWGRSDSATS